MDTVAEEKIREDERRAGPHRLRLADDVPVRRQPGDVGGEALFEPAVEERRRGRGEDRIAAADRYLGETAPQCTGGAQLEAGAPGQVGQKLRQGASVEQRVTKERER